METDFNLLQGVEWSGWTRENRGEQWPLLGRQG